MIKFKINDVFNIPTNEDFKVISRTEKTILFSYQKFGIELKQFRRKIKVIDGHETIKMFDYYFIAQ